MVLEYKTDALRRFGDQAKVHGEGPWALCSRCYPERRVWLFKTQEERDARFLAWHQCDCGAQRSGYCFGDPSHLRAELKGVAVKEREVIELGPYERPRRTIEVFR